MIAIDIIFILLCIIICIRLNQITNTAGYRSAETYIISRIDILLIDAIVSKGLRDQETIELEVWTALYEELSADTETFVKLYIEKEGEATIQSYIGMELSCKFDDFIDKLITMEENYDDTDYNQFTEILSNAIDGKVVDIFKMCGMN